MKDLKLPVFDCDGVLFDSKETNRAFYNYILEKVGRAPMTEEEVEFIHMHSVKECLEYLFRDEPKKLPLAEKIQQETPFSLFFDYMKMEEGLKEFLSWAKERFHLAVCTNRTTSTIPLFKHFGILDYFDFIMTALKKPKSSKEALEDILKHFQVSPEEALYIGDSEVDERLCKACGVKLIAFKNPKLKADFYAESFEDVRRIVENATRRK
jgi:HAD superfamily hydrolase (TIGR01509 family)